jgi:hypothetical protein
VVFKLKKTKRSTTAILAPDVANLARCTKAISGRLGQKYDFSGNWGSMSIADLEFRRA